MICYDTRFCDPTLCGTNFAYISEFSTAIVRGYLWRQNERRDVAVGCDGVTFMLSLVRIFQLVWKFSGD